MAIEKSIFDHDKMQMLLLQEYGFHLIENQHLPLGTANCYKISCEEGAYFFKEYQKEFTIQDVKREAELVEYLNSKDFPAARFIKTINGNSCILFEGHVISVQEYLEGKSYLNDLPHKLLKDSAKYLGILHSVLKDYPMESSLDEKWAESISVDAVNKKYDRLLEALEKEKADPNYSRIKEDFLFKKELFSHIEDMKRFFKEITYTPSHGDYTACQLLCAEDHVKAVIDFASAAKLPAVWEIMRSYIQAGACRNGEALDIGDFAQYVMEYMKYAPLSKRDLEAMPYVYLFQLFRSAYGYEEYLITKTENRDALLEFAFWRTDICRKIYRNADAISRELLQLV
ncbi:phosphotransferase [Butyrivibrio sp. YAB3001]|uniref:phosphotransferase n=1 Tax=Butyrivibrio sp. YAB3001 TaxID=1520812 RepID=UPI0008F64063|nr:phosphotransferase [Butyrivibrio sp. YAB3001]SFC73215.1 Ser/Thr protein kinase RdoA involved in Cpx stress response, MazF antagonist [Butyrivibrio sp. YAB3001]